MTRPQQEDTVRVSYGTVDAVAVEEERRRRRCDVSAGVDKCCVPSGIKAVYICMVFLIVQGVNALLVGVVLLVVTAACVVLLPLCGLGYYIFLLLFRCGVIDFFAEYDAAMINYVVSPCDQIQIDSASSNDQGNPAIEFSRDYGPPEQLISGLRELSIESGMVLVYMITVRPILAALGLLAVFIMFAVPMLLFIDVLWSFHLLVPPGASGWEIAYMYTALLIMFFVAIMSLDLLVTLWSATMRFFCCERVYTMPLPRSRVASTSTARPNVVVVRIPPSATGVYAFAATGGSSTS